MQPTTIKLTGDLGEKFTPEMTANTANIQQVMSCLYANFPDFKHYILSQDYLYEIFISKANWTQQLTEENIKDIIQMPLQGSTVVISPAIAGSGDKSRGLITAAALIGVSMIPGVGTTLAPILLQAGIAIGLQTILYGYPEKPKKEESTVFFQSSGVVTAEGTPVPLVFGETLVKSLQVISLDITSEYKKL
jgi:predicted phage tail protein